MAENKSSGCASFLLYDDSAESLVVVINSYVNHLHGAPKYDHSTKLEMFSLARRFHASFIWFAETRKQWYLQYENTMLEKILSLIEYPSLNSLKRVILIGISAGGYSAIRLCVRLKDLLALESVLTIQAIAVNPQTGFVDGVTECLIDMPNDEAAPQSPGFGCDPVFLGYEEIRSIGEHLQPVDRGKWFSEINISNLIAATQLRNWPNSFIYVYYDSLNPIERFYSEQVAEFSCVKLFPIALGVRHSVGCNILAANILNSNELNTIHLVPKRGLARRIINQLPGSIVDHISMTYL